jgi:hypothetical protein
MARVLPLLEDLEIPVYTSPRLAVERVRDLLIEQLESVKEAGVLARAR